MQTGVSTLLLANGVAGGGKEVQASETQAKRSVCLRLLWGFLGKISVFLILGHKVDFV